MRRVWRNWHFSWRVWYPMPHLVEHGVQLVRRQRGHGDCDLHGRFCRGFVDWMRGTRMQFFGETEMTNLGFEFEWLGWNLSDHRDNTQYYAFDALRRTWHHIWTSDQHAIEVDTGMARSKVDVLPRRIWPCRRWWRLGKNLKHLLNHTQRKFTFNLVTRLDFVTCHGSSLLCTLATITLLPIAVAPFKRGKLEKIGNFHCVVI